MNIYIYILRHHNMTHFEDLEGPSWLPCIPLPDLRLRGAFCLASGRSLRNKTSKSELREEWAKEQPTATAQVVAHFAWCFAKLKDLLQGGCCPQGAN